MTLTNLRAALLASAAALLAACAATEPGPCHGIRCDAIGDLAPSPAVVRCWIARGTAADPAARVDDVTCRWTRLAGSIGETSVTINVRGKDFQVTGGVFLGSMAPDLDHVVLRVHDGDYPLIVQLEHGAQWPGAAGANFPAALASEQTLAASTSAPIVFRLPYDVWHVRLISRLGVARAHVDDFALPVAPFRQVGPAAPADATTFASHVELPLVSDGELGETWLAAPSGAHDLPGQVELGSSGGMPIALAGPGTYVLDADGLRLATPAEIAAATATPDGGPADAGHADAPAADAPADAPAADAKPRDAGFPITDKGDARPADAATP